MNGCGWIRCWPRRATSGIPWVWIASIRRSEAVNNVLKHSGANEVRVRVQIEARVLAIEIADNGRGFDVAKGEAKRSGLVHIRERLEEIGGSCACNSVPGEGTHFAFTVPVGPQILAAANGSRKSP